MKKLNECRSSEELQNQAEYTVREGPSSKEELGLAVLIDVRDEFFPLLGNSLTGENPIDKVLNSCNAVMTMVEQSNFVGGCLFGNTALEMTDSTSRFGRIIQEVFSQWKSRIERELRQASALGMLESPIPADAVAWPPQLLPPLKAGSCFPGCIKIKTALRTAFWQSAYCLKSRSNFFSGQKNIPIGRYIIINESWSALIWNQKRSFLQVGIF